MKKIYMTPSLKVVDPKADVVLYSATLEQGEGRPKPTAKEGTSTNWDDDASDAEW